MKIEWRASFPLAIRGAEDALASLETERTNQHVLVGAAVFWLCAGDEQLRLLGGGDEYDRIRDAGPGRCLLGLRLARNGITHGAAVVTATSGLEWPLQWPLTWGEPIWVSLESLLESWVGEPQGKVKLQVQKQRYEQLVAGRPLIEPLREALSWLRTLDTAGYDLDAVPA